MPSSQKSGIWLSRSGTSPFGGVRAQGSSIRIVVADDHGPYRRGLISIFEMEEDMQPVGEAGNGKEAIEQVTKLKPDIVLMDINMPGMDGMEATRKLTDSYPGLPIIMLTMFKGEEHLREARRAGASAYVLKDAGSDVLLQTIRDVMSGETPLLQRDDQHISGSVITNPLVSSSADNAQKRISSTDMLITSNERAILRLLATGLTNDQIGQQTGMPETMVRTYLSEIYRKLGLSGRDAAAQYARERGLGPGLSDEEG